MVFQSRLRLCLFFGYKSFPEETNLAGFNDQNSPAHLVRQPFLGPGLELSTFVCATLEIMSGSFLYLNCTL